jgi:glycerophosphoryl diester phosphodiesterase
VLLTAALLSGALLTGPSGGQVTAPVPGTLISTRTGSLRCADVVQTAHRGLGPDENTLPAFRRAVRRGMGAIETDVRTTSDGRLVLMHDATVDRTTDGSGPVAGLTWRRFSGLRTAHGYHPPSLRRAVGTLAELGARRPDLQLELKARLDGAALRRFGDRIRAYGESRLVVTSTSWSELARVRRALPWARTGKIATDPRAQPDPARAATAGVDFLMVGARAATRDYVAAASRRGLQVSAREMGPAVAARRGVARVLLERPAPCTG